MCVAAIATALMPYAKNVCSQILSYVCALLPEAVPRYVDPSLPMLSLYWRDSSLEIVQSARALFAAQTDRLSPEVKNSFLHSWGLQLAQSSHAAAQKSKWRTVLMLGILGSELMASAYFDDPLARLIIGELLALMGSDHSVSLQGAAAELVARGWKLWRPFVPDVPSLVRS